MHTEKRSKRTLASPLARAGRERRLIVIRGPLDAGKTTICKSVFRNLPLVSLEHIDMRRQAAEAPGTLLNQHREGVILDEAQNAPNMLSLITRVVRTMDSPGRVRFVLPMSCFDGATASSIQELGSRAQVFTLMPFSLAEATTSPGFRRSIDDWLYRGFFGPPFDVEAETAHAWLAEYASVALETVAQTVVTPHDRNRFDAFVADAASRVSRLVRYSQMARAAGVSVSTSCRWLAALEASHIAWLLPAWSPEVGRRLVRTPKLHFVDTGLATTFMGIREPSSLTDHPRRHELFESFIVNEIRKWRLHRGLPPNLYHLRERRTSRLRVPAVSDQGDWIVLTQVLLQDEVSEADLAHMRWLADRLRPALGDREFELRILHTGRKARITGGVHVLPVTHIESHDW